MKILYICQYYPPEMGAPAARASELGRIWARDGHQVTVLTGFPNYPTGIVPEAYRRKMRKVFLREEAQGVKVERCWLAAYPNSNPWQRVLNYFSFTFTAAMRGLVLEKPDIVIATSPQLVQALAGLWVGKLRGIPFIFEVRDLWPESLTWGGDTAANRVFHRVMGIISRVLYRYAEHIVVVSPAFTQHLIDHWHVPRKKISLVMNGVDHEMFTVEGSTGNFRQDLNLQGRFVVSFVGIIGNAHGLSTIVQAARLLEKTHPDVMILMVGDGADKEKVQFEMRDAALGNILMTGMQPREVIPEIIRSSDACLVLLRKAEVFKTVIPTKMLEFMACGKPLILGVEGQAKAIVEEAASGICIEPENAGQLAAAIVRLKQDPALCKSLGSNGRAWVVRKMSREQTAKDYVAVIESTLERRAD